MNNKVIATALLAAPLLAISFLTASMTAPAAAADLPDPLGPEVPLVAPTYDWSGFYLGLQSGYSWNRVDTDRLATQDLNGASLGALAGYNFQFGKFVLGIENDFSYNFSDDDETGLNWDASARARLGYAWDRTLFYTTGGVAAAGGSLDISGIGKNDDILIGWTAGGGMEYAVYDNITLRADYRYSDFGSVDFGGALGDFKANQHKATFGVSYKF